MASTETGHIFGTIAYNTPTSPNDQVVINLAEIHVDIMDYIHPATCSCVGGGVAALWGV